MDAIFYTVADNDNVLEKTLESALVKNVLFLNSNNILTPTVRLLINNITEFLKRNYCFIETLQRYYFIDSVTIERGGIATLELSIDVLMTYKDDILRASAEIVKSDSGVFAQMNYQEKNEVSILKYTGSHVFNGKSLVLVSAVT